MPASEKVRVQVTWSYQDVHRFGIELTVQHYPITHGFQTTCPLTQLEVRSAGENILLYRNPEQIDLNEFYTITQHNRWYCTKQAEEDGFADYLFSLTHFYEDESIPDFGKDASLLIELGKVIASNALSVTTVPMVGTFSFPLKVKPGSQNLTWLNQTTLIENGISVEINRVAVNPSFTLLDACVAYQDHHFWRPRAKLIVQSYEAYSTELLPTFPYPYDRDTTLENTHRCYSLIIPFAFPLDSPGTFRIGIDQVEIVNDDPGIVTTQDCDMVRQGLEESYPNLKIRCYVFESHGEIQHWFEVLSYPSDLSAQAAYALVESAFTRTISGSWYIEIHLES